MNKTELSSFDLTGLRDLLDKGRRRLKALEAADFADLMVSARYEPYPPDSDAVLDRNFTQTAKVRAALRLIEEEIKRRESGSPESGPSADSGTPSPPQP